MDILLIILILNGIQGIILAYILKNITSKFGKGPDYFTRMLSDLIFIKQMLKDDKISLTKKEYRIYRYAIYITIFQFITGTLFLLLFIFS